MTTIPEERLAPDVQAAPSPGTTDWVPMWNLVPGSLSPIQDVILGAAAASVDFPNIPQAFAHLMLMFNATRDQATADFVTWAVNGDVTAANYSAQFLQGIIAAASASTAANRNVAVLGGTARPLSGGGQLSIPNYTGGGRHSIFGVSYANQNLAIVGNDYATAGAITRLTFAAGAGNFVAGSRFTLYGVAI